MNLVIYFWIYIWKTYQGGYKSFTIEYFLSNPAQKLLGCLDGFVTPILMALGDSSLPSPVTWSWSEILMLLTASLHRRTTSLVASVSGSLPLRSLMMSCGGCGSILSFTAMGRTPRWLSLGIAAMWTSSMPFISGRRPLRLPGISVLLACRSTLRLSKFSLLFSFLIPQEISHYYVFRRVIHVIVPIWSSSNLNSWTVIDLFRSIQYLNVAVCRQSIIL